MEIWNEGEQKLRSGQDHTLLALVSKPEWTRGNTEGGAGRTRSISGSCFRHHRRILCLTHKKSVFPNLGDSLFRCFSLLKLAIERLPSLQAKNLKLKSGQGNHNATSSIISHLRPPRKILLSLLPLF